MPGQHMSHLTLWENGFLHLSQIPTDIQRKKEKVRFLKYFASGLLQKIQ